MDESKKYIVYVIQSGVDKKDVYVAQTTKSPELKIQKMNNTDNPKTLPKPLGSMLPVSLRKDLAGENNVFVSQDGAVEYRKTLSEKLIEQGYNLRSKRPFFFGRKKSKKNKNTGKYELVLDPLLFRQDSVRPEEPDSREVFSYGRKKSSEWNDDAAMELHRSLAERSKELRSED